MEEAKHWPDRAKITNLMKAKGWRKAQQLYAAIGGELGLRWVQEILKAKEPFLESTLQLVAAVFGVPLEDIIKLPAPLSNPSAPGNTATLPTTATQDIDMRFRLPLSDTMLQKVGELILSTLALQDEADIHIRVIRET